MIFLSASIPVEQSGDIYFESADITAIRDCIRALAKVVIPRSHLIWGGHPAITPMIRYILMSMNKNANEHVTLYQSAHFEHEFIPENKDIEKIVITDSGVDEKNSLQIMRESMIIGNKYKAGVFIGGMKGVILEYEMFKLYHPEVPVFPIASTGGAAKILYEQYLFHDQRLVNDFAYMALFRSLFKKLID
jgi:hypothetical protein